MEHYPPETEARALPNFPAVERDISVIVDEDVPWTRLRATIDHATPEHLEAVEFVATYRGRQIKRGRKSITLRLRFRAPDRTLVHESVTAQVESVITGFEAELGAEVRR